LEGRRTVTVELQPSGVEVKQTPH